MTQQQTQRRTVDIYTDGACSGNPGPGGWAAIIKYGEHAKEISGNMHHTTNNRMELFAVISALGALKEPCKVRVHSDSSYVVDAFNKRWIDSWQNNGWITSTKKPVENQDLWKQLVNATKDHVVKWYKVKGHSDDEMNNLCDKLARDQIKKNVK